MDVTDPGRTVVLQKLLLLDGPAIRNANPGDSRKSIRASRFAETKNYFGRSPENFCGFFLQNRLGILH